MKKFLGNKALVTIIAAIICVIIITFFYNYRVKKIIDVVEIPVALERLDSRTEITEDNIKTIPVARSLLSPNVIIDKNMIIGKYINYNTFVPEDGMFYSSDVVTWEDMPDSTWSNISEGKTIVYLDIEEGSAYGNKIYPGDKIDLYMKTTYSNKLAYAKFIEKIKVLAVKDQYGKHIFEKSPSTGKPAQLIFEVDEEMFLTLKCATFLSGTFEIIPVPRNAEYTASEGETLISNDILNQQIKNYCTMLLPDVVSEDENNKIDIVE